MARFVNKPELKWSKWSRDKIAAQVYEILSRYTDFENVAKNRDVPFEDQQIYLDSLDLTEIAMYLKHDFQIELDLDNEPEFFAGDYTPRRFIDFMCKKLNLPATKCVTLTPKPEHTTDKDVAILVRTARPLQLQRGIRHIYGVNVPLNELRALKSFTEYQEVIRRAINKQNSK